jgi:HSP20 family molecular chaperone IbpA
MTVTMEVPGVRKADLRVTLQRCPYSRVKQLTVSGTTAPVFPDESVGYCLRERRFGDFVRSAPAFPAPFPAGTDAHAPAGPWRFRPIPW